MKECSKCNVSKFFSEYYFRDKRTGHLHAQCKACYKETRKNNYQKHYKEYGPFYRERAKKYREKLKTEYRDNLIDYLSDKECEDCGENNMVVLEFDHIDPEHKKFSISQAVRLGHRWEAVELEIKKCRILCSNCHKKRTAKQFGWYKS